MSTEDGGWSSIVARAAGLRGLTDGKSIAGHVGLSVNTVSGILAGVTDARPATVDRLRHTLGLPAGLLEDVAAGLVRVVWMDDLLANLRKLQGEVAGNEASELARRTEDALLGVLRVARDPEFAPLWSAPRAVLQDRAKTPSAAPRRSGERQTVVPSFIASLLIRVLDARARLALSPLLVRPLASHLDELAAQAERIPKILGATPEEQLFAEYMVGLAIFEALTHLVRLLGDPSVMPTEEQIAAACSDSSYVDGLRGVFAMHGRALDRLRERFADGARDPWTFFHAALTQEGTTFQGPTDGRSRSLTDAIKRVVSLRWSGSPLPETLTAAQAQHWLGWGGPGELVARATLETRRPEAKNSLIEVLGEHQHLAFDWHQARERINDPLLQHFGHRQEHFKRASAPLAEYAAACTAVIADHEALRRDRQEVRLWGDAVGRIAIAEQRIFRYLGELGKLRGAPQVAMRSVLTEILPSFVDELRHGTAREILGAEIRYRDLARSFPGEESVPENLKDLFGAFDIYSASIALHQICDANAGRDRVEAILRFATRLLRPGAPLSLPDVGDGVYLQTLFLPVNLIDREGNPHLEHLFDKKSFRAVACTSDGGRMGEATSQSRIKLPLPLLSLTRGTPASIDALGLPIYTHTPMLVVELPYPEFRKFDTDWSRAGDAAARDQLVSHALEMCWPGMSLSSDIEARVAKLGASLPASKSRR